MRCDQMPRQGMTPCGECGMPCYATEYHPYAACLMFKACENSETVRANLNAVVAHGREMSTLARVIATKPRNWRERRQKARVIAQAYRPRKPEPF